MTIAKPLNLPSLTCVAALYLGIAIAAPSYNAQQIAPRSVFLTLPDTLPAPELSLNLEPLASGRWRLTVEAAHFQFTELCVAEASALPVGHAHIIVNGEKVASAYQPIIDLDLEGEGLHQITVILRGQDHRALIGKDGLIAASMRIVVPKPAIEQPGSARS